MSFFDDLGKAIVGAGEQLGNTVATVFTDPGSMFQPVEHDEKSTVSAFQSALATGSDKLRGVDMVVALPLQTLNDELRLLWEKNTLGFATGKVHVGDGTDDGFVLDGTWGAPSLRFADQAHQLWLTVSIHDGTFGTWSGFGASSKQVSIPIEQFSFAFRVDLDLSTMQQDDLKTGLPVPEIVTKALSGQLDFSVQRLALALQQADLANYDPSTSVLNGAALTGDQVHSAQQCLSNYFKLLPPGSGVLGYALTSSAAAGDLGAGLLNATSVSFSTTKASSPTFNYLLMTQSRRFPDAAGIYGDSFVPKGWAAALVISREIFVGDLIEKRILAVVADVMGAGGQFTFENGAWKLASIQSWSGRTVVDANPNSMYSDGNVVITATAVLSAVSGGVVITINGSTAKNETLWMRPGGARGDVGTYVVQSSFSLAVTFYVDAKGAVSATFAKPNPKISSSSSRGNLGDMASVFTNAASNALDAMTSVNASLQAMTIGGVADSVAHSMAMLATNLVLPGGRSFQFQSLTVDGDLNLIAQIKPVG